MAPFGFTRDLPHIDLWLMGLTYHQYSPPNPSPSFFLLPISSSFLYLLVFLGADLPNGNEGTSAETLESLCLLSPSYPFHSSGKINNGAGHCERLLVTYSSYPLSCSFLPNKSRISESVVCCLGPEVFHLHLRKLEHLTVCRCQKKAALLLGYLNTSTNTMGY